MREQIRVLWIDDSTTWLNATSTVLFRNLKDMNIDISLRKVSDGELIYNSIKRQSEGFNAYDIFLIDYNLSINIDENGKERAVYGNDIIKELRKYDIDVDILFYSSEQENTIRDLIIQDIGDYEGVYISNRYNFIDKALKIIIKNSRKLYSISNVRGFLTEQTSENDYIVNSFISEQFNSVDSNKQKEILSILKNRIDEDMEKRKLSYFTAIKDLEDLIKYIDSGHASMNSIRRLIRRSGLIITQSMKYDIFERLVGEIYPDGSTDCELENYFEKIVRMRNNLAHKKLVLCKEQKNIIYADDTKQYWERVKCCSVGCRKHIDEHKISVEEWNNLRSLICKYAKYFDDILEKLPSSYSHSS